jgi:hypothetical protein
VPSTLARPLRLFAALATLAWLALAAAGGFALLPEALVAFAIACVVPLGVGLAMDADAAGRARPTAWIATRLVPLGGALGLTSFTRPPGIAAAALASAWLLATIAVSLGGAARLARRGPAPVEELAIDVGHLFLPVGAIWLVASRAGASLLGFHEPVVLYTAAHFHFAGFAAPMVAGLVGRDLALRRAPSERRAPVTSRVVSEAVCHCDSAQAPSAFVARAYAATTVVVLLGVPLVAAGITLGHALELPAAVLLGLAMLGTMTWLARAGVARLKRRDASGALLVVSGLALAVSMALAVAFAATGSAARGAGVPWIAYETMAAVHGSSNAFAFAACAMLAFTWRPPRRRHDALGGTWPRLFGEGRVGPRFFDRAGAVDGTRSVDGQLGSLDDFANETFAPARVHEGVRAFYEHTARYELKVTPEWHPPFRVAGRVFAWLARGALGQLVLPVRPEADERVTTRLFAVCDALDGRTDVRGYVRAYGEGAAAQPNFVAAYSTHSAASGLRLLSAAFPLPYCALVAVLRFEDGEVPGSLYVTSRPREGEGPGDEGLFLVTRLGPVRLPVDERIDVWAAAAGELRARHATRVCGLACFTLSYAIRIR